MKKIIVFITCICCCYVANAQQNFSGAWQGKLNVGNGLTIVFHITKNADGLFTSTMDSPDQSAFGIGCESTIVSDDAIKIMLTKLGVQFSGNIINDTLLKGFFMQRGAKLPLDLTRADEIKTLAPIRPQTPVPPFPYKSIDVEYDNADKSLHYGATITIPNGSRPFPAIVLITGSWQQDRDETIFLNKPFAVIADHLTRNGYIVMRVDDRGAGKSTGDFSTSTSADFEKDVNTSVDYLKGIDGIDKNRIGLMGHSEGGMIAPMVATERKDINFIVLLAGPGVKIIDLMAEQNASVFKSEGVVEEDANRFKTVFTEVSKKIIAAADTTAAYNNAYKYFTKWAAEIPTKSLATFGFDTEEKRIKYVKALVSQFSSPWFKYFMSYDPTPYLKKLTCKVLALNGSKDIQVVASQNLPGIEAALKKSKVKDYEVKELPGLNHLFQTCHECTVAEYGKMEESFSPVALNIITEWLNKNVK